MASTFTHQFDTPVYTGAVTFPTQLFINGEFVDPFNKGMIECASSNQYKWLIILTSDSLV